MTATHATSNRRIIDLAIKDLRQITRDRNSFLFLLIMPVIFTLLFGYAFGGNATADPRLPVGLVDADSGEFSSQLAAMLAGSEVIRIDVTDETAAVLQERVADEDISAAILIPAGFSAALLRGEALPVTVVGGGQTGYTIEGEVQSRVARLAAAVKAADLSVEVAVRHDLLPNEGDRQAYFETALAGALEAWEAPPVTYLHSESSALADEAQAAAGNYSIFAHSSPGMMAQFAIAGLMGAAGILAVEKKTGSVQRLITTNMSRGQILAGHFLAMFIMILAQLAVLIVFGQLFLDLPYMGRPLATLSLSVMTALFTASMGLLIGVVAKSEEQVIVLALVPMFVLSAFGGAWVPLEFTPPSFYRVASVTPVAFVMDGYKDILVRGQGLEAISPALLALLLYAALLLGLAIWRFRAS